VITVWVVGWVPKGSSQICFEAKASGSRGISKLGEWSDWVRSFYPWLAQQWRLPQKRNLAHR